MDKRIAQAVAHILIKAAQDIVGAHGLMDPRAKAREDAANCDTKSKVTEDIGDMAKPTQSACVQLAPLPMLPRPTPITFAAARARRAASPH
jgi:hypothetical protein